MSNDRKTKDIFFGIVAIATLIVAIIGATLAYFSITASSNEGAINAQAATVSITYKDGQQVTAQANQLIPATYTVVKNSYEENFVKQQLNAPTTNICLDKNDRQVCSVYRFSVSSDVAARNITATLNHEHNGFTYLSYSVYDVTNNAWIEVDPEKKSPISQGKSKILNSKCDNTNNNEEDGTGLDDDCWRIEDGRKIYSSNAVHSIFGIDADASQEAQRTVFNTVEISGTEQVYDVILFIEETSNSDKVEEQTNHNVDQGKKYQGTIIVEVNGVNGDEYISGEW